MSQGSSTLSNTISGFSVAGLGAFIFFQSRDLSAMGSVFPTMISAVLIIASTVLILSVLLRSSLANKISNKKTVQESEHESSNMEYGRGVLLILVMAVWLFSMHYLGILLSGALAFGAFTFLTGYGKLPIRVMLMIWACGSVVVVGFIMLMTQVLLIPVPRGQFFIGLTTF